MAVTAMHFAFRIDLWTCGETTTQLALATYRAACERWPGTPITLRDGARDRGIAGGHDEG